MNEEQAIAVENEMQLEQEIGNGAAAEVEAEIGKEQEEVQPKTELTDEEAKIAAGNVSKLLELMDHYAEIKQKRENKLKKYKEEIESLPEGHWKRPQLEAKATILDKKIHPTIVWDSSSKGTYKKEKAE